MEALIRDTNLLNNCFEMLIHRKMSKVSPKLISKHQIPIIAPESACYADKRCIASVQKHRYRMSIRALNEYHFCPPEIYSQDKNNTVQELRICYNIISLQIKCGT